MEAIYVLLGVLLGFLFGLIPPWYVFVNRGQAFIHALSIEIEICAESFHAHRKDEVMAPLYRLPTTAWKQALPWIIEYRLMPDTDLKTCYQFYDLVEQLNRGLDLVQDTVLGKDDGGSLYTRNQMKVDQVLNRDLAIGNTSCYERTSAALASAKDRINWTFPIKRLLLQ